MTKLPSIAVLSACLSWCLRGAEVGPDLPSEQSAKPPESEEFRTFEEWNADALQRKNLQRVLPTMDYWGFQTNAWGQAWAGAETVAPAGDFLGIQCRRIGLVDPESKILLGFRYEVIDLSTNRVERLELYNRLRTRLESEYRSPSSELKPRVVVGGRDAYVQGLRREYGCEWRGTETKVLLQLGETNLSVVFEAVDPKLAAKRRRLRLGAPNRSETQAQAASTWGAESE